MSEMQEPVSAVAGPRRVDVRVLANSIPKSGTHLLKKCLSLLPGLLVSDVHVEMSQTPESIRTKLNGLPTGGVATGHLFPREAYIQILEALGYSSLLIIRDPRDVVVSRTFHILQASHHPLQVYLDAARNDDERLLISILGIKEKLVAWDDVGLRNIDDLYRQFLAWSTWTWNLVIRFENLVGPQGAGSRGDQVREISRIGEHLGVRLSPAEMERIAEGVFDVRSPTFRRGDIGGWKDYFSPVHKQAFKTVAGQLLIDLGYEQGYDW